MYSFEDTARELYEHETAKDILLKLTDKLLIPNTNLSYAERMDTPIELDMTYGEWLAMLRDYRLSK